jgi:hypothetical protein
MSFHVTENFVQQYKAGWEHLVQQRGSRLRDCVRVEDQYGKASFYDQVDATTVRRRTVRHGDSPYIPTPTTRRMNVLQDYDWGDYIDDEDKIRTLNDPTNPYVQAAAWAMGRAMDQEVVDAALGTAYTGETGSTPVPFPSSQLMDHGNGSGSAEYGLTLEILLDAKALLDDNEVDEEEPRFIATTSHSIRNLLADDKLTNADYTTVKALVYGEINEFLGFSFKRISSSIMPRTATDRSSIIWAESGLLLGIGHDTTARIAERPDKGFSTYVFNSMTIGGTRMQEKKVIHVLTDEENETPLDPSPAP